MTPEPAVLFDFGDTLADETWMYADLGVFADWPNTDRRVVAPLGTDWGLGRITTSEVVGRMAAALGAKQQAVEQHFAQLHRAIRFFARVVAAIRRRRERGGTQALVTVNPADFGSILTLHGLQGLFDVVVISGQEGLDHKPALAVLAAERMGIGVEGAVLIDNIERNVTGFRVIGGLGYHFRGEDQFVADVTNGLVPGFVPEDVK
jgi:phosphoglycolate phosphatase-like HAD superfamily hydrolase